MPIPLSVVFLFILTVVFHTEALAQSRYGSRFSTKENAAPPRLILSDSSGNPISMTLSGAGHIRWLSVSDSENYLYSPGVAGILNTEIELSRALKVDYEMELQQSRLAEAHASSQNVASRLALHSIYEGTDIPWFPKIHTQMGNLRKITLGQGLTLKHLEADGVRIQAFPHGLTDPITSLTYISRGYGDRGHIVILGRQDIKAENGIYVMSRLDNLHTTSSLGTLWGAFGRIPMMGFDLVYEGGLSTSVSRESGLAGMLSPRFSYQTANTTLTMSGTVRGYSATYLAGFNQNHAEGPETFVKTYHSLLEEEEDYDNWRNLLLQQSGTHAAGSWSLNARFDQRLMGILWGFTQAEWTEEQSNTIQSHSFLTAGIKAVYSPDHTVYLAASNKVLHGGDTDAPVLQQVPVFVTLGMFYRF